MVIQESINFILEALKDKLSLLVLVLSDAVLCVELLLFAMEHVGTKIKNCTLVHLRCFSFYISINLTLFVGVLVEINELGNSTLQVSLVQLLLKALPAKV